MWRQVVSTEKLEQGWRVKLECGHQQEIFGNVDAYLRETDGMVPCMECTDQVHRIQRHIRN